MPTLLSTSALLGAALLLSTTAVGVSLAVASGERPHSERDSADRAPGRHDGAMREAGEHGARRHQEGRPRRQAEEDGDSEGDEDGRGGPGRVQPARPERPPPGSGLFSGKARPKVDVQ